MDAQDKTIAMIMDTVVVGYSFGPQNDVLKSQPSILEYFGTLAARASVTDMATTNGASPAIKAGHTCPAVADVLLTPRLHRAALWGDISCTSGCLLRATVCEGLPAMGGN